jgi:cytochrome b561
MRAIATTYTASNVRDRSVQQEEVMRFGKSALSAAALCVALTGTALAQDSGEPASVTGCLHMQKKVSAALDANQSSANYSAARNQARGAQGFCSQGLYKIGVDGYAKALDLLGAS